MTNAKHSTPWLVTIPGKQRRMRLYYFAYAGGSAFGFLPWQAAAFQAPSGPVEECLAEIWRGMLQLDRIGRDDNFFDLGGHSLLATQLVARIGAELGVEISLMQVFQAVTLAELAAAIAATQELSNDG